MSRTVWILSSEQIVGRRESFVQRTLLLLLVKLLRLLFRQMMPSSDNYRANHSCSHLLVVAWSLSLWGVSNSIALEPWKFDFLLFKSCFLFFTFFVFSVLVKLLNCWQVEQKIMVAYQGYLHCMACGRQVHRSGRGARVRGGHWAHGPGGLSLLLPDRFNDELRQLTE